MSKFNEKPFTVETEELIIIEAPFAIKKSLIGQKYQDFLEQKKNGVIFVPAGYHVRVVPGNTQLAFVAIAEDDE